MSRLRQTHAHASDGVEPVVVELAADDLARLTSLFAAPPKLRNLGIASWLLVGFLLLVGAIAVLLGTMSTIVNPVLAALIVAVVASPSVAALQRHRVPRAAGAAIVLLALVAVAVVIGILVIGGITSQRDAISGNASAAADKVESWLKSLGVDDSGAAGAKSSVTQSVPDILSTLIHGVLHVFGGLTSLAFGLSFAVLSLFFLLKDGPGMRFWVDRHLGVPLPVAETVTGEVIRSLRGYFRGVTLVAAFNGVVVGLGALILGVPLAGTIAVVTFVTAYVPYVGAFVAGAFAVILALGGTTVTKAVIMLVIVLLANGLLQNILQPFIFGSVLNLNPLVVLIVTIGAGCLFGMIGMVLAAPLTAAATHIVSRLGEAQAAALARADGAVT